MSLSESTLETTDFTADLTEEGGRFSPPQPAQVKVFYYVDDQKVPFATVIPVPPRLFTLAHLRCALQNRNFKCYIKQTDETLKM